MWAVVSLVSPNCPWLVQLCTNHFVLVLCRSVWVSEACQFFLVPSRNSNTPLYPSKVLWATEHTPNPYSSIVFNLGFTFESLKELGAHHGLGLSFGKSANTLIRFHSQFEMCNYLQNQCETKSHLLVCHPWLAYIGHLANGPQSYVLWTSAD